jgi:hypothetical protein
MELLFTFLTICIALLIELQAHLVIIILKSTHHFAFFKFPLKTYGERINVPHISFLVRLMMNFRHLIPGFSVYQAASLLLPDATPLLEEKGDTRFKAFTSNISYPFLLHQARSRSGFSAADHPVKPRRIKVVQMTDERLHGYIGTSSI